MNKWKYICFRIACIIIVIGFLPIDLHAMQGLNQQKYVSDEISHTILEQSDTFYKIDFGTEISVEVDGLTVEDALKEVARTTGLMLTYRGDIMRHKKVTLIDKKISVSDALDYILMGTELDYMFSKDGYLLVYESEENLTKIQGQEEISGTVTDAQSGETLPGVNILVKGTSKGTSTDEDGTFEITVPSMQDTLVISFIGYQTQEIALNGQVELYIQLIPQAVMGEEMVVVGYGEQEKESVTGSISSVSGENLEKAPVGNVSTLLAGRLSGLVTHQSSGTPGSDDATLRIRGISTTGNSAPTVIVDGVQRSFNNLDPNEIEDITILKDAAAAAVYGVQGANGVILVTTKEGISKAPQISYKSSFSLSQNTRFPEFMDGVEYAKYYNRAREMDELPIVFSEDHIDRITNGDPNGILGNTNWVDEIFSNNSPTNHHNLSVDGGTDNINYFLSLGFFDQKGSVDNYNFERYNIRSNIDAHITPELDVSLKIGGRLEKRDRPYFGAGPNSWNGVINQAIRAHPYVPMYTSEGNPTATRTASSIVNPIAARDHSGSNNSKMSVFQSNLSVSYDLPLLSGLTVEMMGSYDRDYTYSKSFNSPYKLQVFDVNSMNYQEQYAPNSTSGMASLEESFSQANRLTLQPSIRYANAFNEKHEVDVLALYEQSSRISNNFGASKEDFDFLDLPELTFGKEVPNASSVYGISAESPRAGFVSRIKYAFDSKYLFEVASRYDGSYRFHQDRRWGFFPALSAGWVISEEGFFDPLRSVVSHLKLRASVGRLGNDQIGEYRYLSSMNVDNDAVVLGTETENALYTGSVPNRDITWETTTTYNGGLEAQFWDQLLGIEFDWFYKKTTDILQSTGGEYPPSMGGNYPGIVNSGIVDNRGFDLTISHDHSINDFAYGARLNTNWSRNKIIKMNESPNIPDYIRNTGRSIGGKMGLIALGLFESDEEAATHPTVADGALAGDIKYKDINGDGKITYDQDRTFIGESNIPELMFGLDLYANWKGFDFSTLIQGAANADIALMGLYPGVGYSNTEFTRPFYHGGNSPLYLVEDSWTYENTDAKYPRLTTLGRANNAWASTFWTKDASYVRLKNLQIGYTIPKPVLNRYGIDSLRIYLGGANLFTISEFKYLDPEAPDVNNGYYPQQKTFTIGLNLSI